MVKLFDYLMVSRQNMRVIQKGGWSKNQLLEINNKIADLVSDKAKQIDKVQLFEQYKDITELNRLILDSFINRIESGKIDHTNNDTRPIKIDWKLYAN